ncbi:Hsp20 family protein [Pelagibacterium luteolum]|uniref:Molecular chaperone IbpA, HSP20 family n=1 Tax=Pelagibacterium luteolum TaxID=440168 RepID=A0A1G7SNY2_9HYPH|nr:Hsp20 family protein [Pelagibacterium luteolum]SDG24797.1 Molecular chaperone IbpA, HSP20 family [Pelagibacterium luteolum]
MTRVSLFSAPFLLGFDAFEERFDRLAKATEGYPPYNIERISAQGGESFLIAIAVAGFSRNDLEVIGEDNQLIVRGRQNDEGQRQYLHRGIAARQFQRTFLLADGMRIEGAELKDGLLVITVYRPVTEPVTRRIDIRSVE